MANTPSGGNGGTNIETLGLGLDTTGLVSASKDVDNFIDKELKAVDATEKLESSAKATSSGIREMGSVTTQTAKSVEELVIVTQAQARNMVRIEDVMNTKNKSAREQLALAQQQYEIDKAALELKAQTAKRMLEEQAAGGILLARLNEMVTTYGKTREELLRLQAVQLGVADKAEPMIAALERQARSLTQVEYAANRAMEAQDQLNSRTSSTKEYGSMAAMQAEESASLKRQENRKRDMKALEDYTRKEIEADKNQMRSKEQAANAQMIANDQVTQKRIRAAEERSRAAEKEALDEIRWAQMSSHAKRDELNKLKMYQEKGIAQPTIDATFSQAAQKAAADGQRLSDAFRDISFNSSRARTEIIVLAHEMVQGRFSRMIPSMMVLMEYTNMSTLAMSGLGLGILGVVGAAGAFMYAIAGAESQTKKLNDALNRTNNASGITKDGLRSVADAAGALNGNYTDAYEAAAKLAGSGKFTADQLRLIIPAVTEMERYFSGSLATSIQEFESLVVRASTKGIQSALGVSRAVLDLNDKYHFLNVAQLEEIITMERAGQVREASALAIQLFGKENKRVTEEAKVYAGNLEKAWHAVAGAIGQAKQALLNWGTVKSPAQVEEQRLEIMIAGLKSYTPTFGVGAHYQMINDAEAKLLTLRRKNTEAETEALAVGDKRRAQDEALGIIRRRQIENDTRLKRTQTEGDKALEKFENENQAIEKAQPGYLKSHAKDLADMRAAIIKEHAPKKVRDPASNDFKMFNIDTKEVDADLKLAQEAVADNERLIKSALQAKVMTEKVAYDQMKQNRDSELQALETWYSRRMALVSKNEAKLKPEQKAKELSEIKGEYDNKYNDITGASGKNDADRINDEQKQYDKLKEKIDKANESEVDRIDKAISKQRDHNEAIGRTDEQKELALARRDADLARANELEAEGLRLDLARADATRDPRETERMQTRLDHLTAMIGKQRELSGLHAQGATLEAASPEKYSKDADKLAKDWKNAGDTIAESLTRAFGKAGKSAADMFKSYTQGQSRQIELNKQLVKELAASEGTADQAKRDADAEDRYNAESARNRMNQYGDMAGAAASFFDEQSKGYKALTMMSQIFHAAELAMTMAEMIPKATAAILNQGSGDPYTAFARMASMAAIVAGLGVAVGSVSGNGSATLAKDRQEAAGKGSVFGAADSRSDSIAKSLEILEDGSKLGLVHSSQMVSSLRFIATNIGGLTNMVLRTAGISGKVPGVEEGYSGSTAKNILAGGVFGLAAGMIPGLDKMMAKLFGTKTTLVDQGLVGGQTSLGSVMGSGRLDIDSYNDVNKKKKFLGISYSDKTSESRSDLPEEVSQQFGLIIENLSKGVFAAADAMGLGGQEFVSKMNGFVVDIGHISTKGLTGEEIEKQFQAVFSKVGDDMAKFGLSGLDPFRKAGEGYLETAVRVANNLTNVKDVFAVMGKDFGKTGMEAVNFSEDLVSAAGGIDKLTDRVNDFMSSFLTNSQRLVPQVASLDKALKEAGLSTQISTDEFANYASAALDGSIEGNKLFASMMELAPAFYEVRSSQEEAMKSELDMRAKLAELMKDEGEQKRVTAKLREIELRAIDASLRPMQERIWALEDEATAIDKAKAASDEATAKSMDAVDKAFDGLRRVVEANKKAITQRYNADVEAYRKNVDLQKNALKDQLTKAQESKTAIQSVWTSLSNAMKSTQIDSTVMDRARRKEAQSYLASVRGTDLTKAGGLKDALDSITKPSKGMFTSFLDYARDQARTAQVIEGLESQAKSSTDLAEEQIELVNQQIKSVETASESQLEQMKLQYERDIKAQDDILENAEAQINALKGIDTSVKTMVEALKILSDAIMAAQNAKNAAASGSQTGSSQIEKLYNDLLGRSSDKAGMDFWIESMKSGNSLDTIKGDFLKSPEYLNKQATDANKSFFDNWYNSVPSFDVGTNGVPRDMLAMVHKDERIVPAADNRELMSRLSNPGDNNRAMVSEIRALRREVSLLRDSNTRENEAIHKQNAISANKLKRIEAVGVTVKESVTA